MFYNEETKEFLSSLNDEFENAKKIEDKEEKIEKKSNIVIIILTVIFALMAIALVVVFFVLPALSNEKPVTIPSCQGEKVSACEKKLQALGLEVDTKIKTEASATVDKNRVTRTEPEEGRSVKPSTSVVIYKSLGEEVYVIEDYTGKNYIEVQTILETQYGLKVTIEKKEALQGNEFLFLHSIPP